MDIYLTASQFGKYPGLAASTLVNNCYSFYSSCPGTDNNVDYADDGDDDDDDGGGGGGDDDDEEEEEVEN